MKQHGFGHARALWHIHRCNDCVHRPLCFGAFFVLFVVPLVGRGELPSAHTMKQKGQRLQESLLHLLHCSTLC